MIVAILPARGGSKRIPKKNIKKINGLPIIAWTLMSVISSNLFDKIIVSTDDKQIAKIAKKYKASVPFLRPKKLSNDKVGTNEVISHTIKWLKSEGFDPDFVCCIYPTSAAITPSDLKKGLEKIKSEKFNYVFSGQKNASNFFRSFRIKKKGELEMLFPANYKKRTQDLKEVYVDAGQFYWAKTKTWLEKKEIFQGKSAIIEIPKSRAVDIDTPEDWELAKKIYTFLRYEK